MEGGLNKEQRKGMGLFILCVAYSGGRFEQRAEEGVTISIERFYI